MTRLSHIAPFKKIGLAVDRAVAPEAVKPDALQQIVLALRGEWK